MLGVPDAWVGWQAPLSDRQTTSLQCMISEMWLPSSPSLVTASPETTCVDALVAQVQALARYLSCFQ